VTFIASKLLWIVIAPGNLLAILLLAATVRLRRSDGRRGYGLLAGTVGAFLLCAVLPVGAWIAAPLENRFPAPTALPERIDGIILLGGAVDEALSTERGQVILGGSGGRVTAAVELAHRFPEARLLISGGDGNVIPVGLAEAVATRELITGLGVAPDRILLESASRNTWENAVLSHEAAKPREGEVWLLVTSALHMPRAVGCFRKAGWSIVPYPSDYRTGPAPSFAPTLSFPGGIDLLNATVKEWVGLLSYWLLGRTSELLPGPDTHG
jgi:uncharacterized SAM-binding protein YcdF (DUF218 family)